MPRENQREPIQEELDFTPKKEEMRDNCNQGLSQGEIEMSIKEKWDVVVYPDLRKLILKINEEDPRIARFLDNVIGEVIKNMGHGYEPHSDLRYLKKSLEEVAGEEELKEDIRNELKSQAFSIQDLLETKKTF